MKNYPEPDQLTPEQALELIPQFIHTVNQQAVTIQQLQQELETAHMALLIVRANLHETLRNLEGGITYEQQ